MGHPVSGFGLSDSFVNSDIGFAARFHKGCPQVNHVSRMKRRMRGFGRVRTVCVSQNRVIIGKFPQRIFIFLTRGGSSFHRAILDARDLCGLGLSCIYGAPFGANDLQSGRIYF
jgi:hypothetical protein